MSASRYVLLSLSVVVMLAGDAVAQQRQGRSYSGQQRRVQTVQSRQRQPSNSSSSRQSNRSNSRSNQGNRSSSRSNQGNRSSSRSNQQNGANRAGEVVKQEVLTTVFSQIVMGGLSSPSGVSVQPKTGHVFIADTGTGRIVRLNDVPGQYDLIPVVTGFPKGAAKAKNLRAGPLGISFLNKYMLAVSAMGGATPNDAIGVYRIPAAGQVDAKDPMFHVAASGQVRQASLTEGEALAVASSPTAIYVASNGQNGKGWIGKAMIVGGKAGEFKTFIAGNNGLHLDAPTSLALGRKGQLVVGQMGGLNVPNDSRLTVYDAEGGDLLLDVATELHDIAAVAVSPQSGRVYAVDFAYMAPEEGGLFRLDFFRDEGEWTCKAARLMSLDRPSGVAFAEDGTLYVTAYGSHSPEHRGGLLVRLYNDSKL